MLDYYDMNRNTRAKAVQFAKENNYPAPSSSLTPIFVSLVTRHRLSLIMGEVDALIDRLFVLEASLERSIEENNLVAVVLIKERLDEEKRKLKAYERLAMKEGPMFKEEVGGITDEMIQRAKDYPFEDLLPDPLRHGRCRCPIHQGKNEQSFVIKNNKGLCYSCGWYGDTIKYVMDTEGYSFPQAVMRLQ